MRNFILGKTLETGGGDVSFTFDTLPAGAVAIGAMNNKGIISPINDASGILDNNKKGYIGLGRANEDGGPVILPFYANHFSYAIGMYQEPSKFSGKLVIPETIVAGEDYTLIVVKKGVKFNERNKWTATVRAKDSDTQDTIGTKLADLILSNVESSGIGAIYNNKELSFGAEHGNSSDYNIIGADALIGIEVLFNNHGFPGYGDASYVRDLANKAAADAGFEYTYMGDVNYLYPNYPLNPLKNADSEDTGFNIITIRFAEPREVKTVDDVVHQIIQIALPSGVNPTPMVRILEALKEASK